MTIPLNDGFTVVLNRQTGQSTYSADADTFSSEIDVFSNQVNDQATEMNATAIEVNQASNAAVGAANYKGAWADATGAASIGESFLHENQVWVLNVNVADITLNEPSSVNADWRAIDSSLYQYAVSQLADGDFSKVAIIYAGLTIDSYDYVVYQEDGRIYERGAVTGTFSSPLDFNPNTGIDSGLSGEITNISRNTDNLGVSNMALIVDQKTLGGSGGSAALGINIRDLNALLINNIPSFLSLGTNSFFLESGIYEIQGGTPALGVESHKSWIYNKTDASIVYGYNASNYSANASDAQNISLFTATVNITTQKEFEIQHRVALANAGNGLGQASSLGQDEQYTFVRIWRLN